jgi:flavin reductase (DIM6/NTAB) family NADH-FMN oxidoreductase RutF
VELISPHDFVDATAAFATGVTVVTAKDGRDDIGSTVTAFASVSESPPMVLVSVAAESYLCEVLQRRNRWAATVLAATQRDVAGRFATAGRPSARLLVASAPHHRGRLSEALIVEGGLGAMECETHHRVAAGDHILFVAAILAIDYISAPAAQPLVRFNRRYHALQ